MRWLFEMLARLKGAAPAAPPRTVSIVDEPTRQVRPEGPGSGVSLGEAPPAAPPAFGVVPEDRADRLRRERERVDTRLASPAQRGAEEIQDRKAASAAARDACPPPPQSDREPAEPEAPPVAAAGADVPGKAHVDEIGGAAILRGIVFLDVETTGLESYARVVTLGMLWVGVDDSVGKLHLVFDPRTDCHPDAARIHGWDDWTLRHQDLFVDHAEQVHAILSGARLVVAHNAAFDLRFLERELRKAGLPWPEVDHACTMQLARERWPGHRAGLDACLARIGVSRQSERHGALEDALLAMVLYYSMHGDGRLTVNVALPRPSNARDAPPRPDDPLPRRSPKKRRTISRRDVQ